MVMIIRNDDRWINYYSRGIIKDILFNIFYAPRTVETRF